MDTNTNINNEKEEEIKAPETNEENHPETKNVEILDEEIKPEDEENTEEESFEENNNA